MTRGGLIVFALALVAAPAAAAKGLRAQDAWTRPAAAGGNAAAFVTLINAGAADAIVGAESPIATRVELHASSMAAGVMRMSREPETPLPAKATVRFAPGGRHIMLVGLKRPLRVGDNTTVTLKLRSGGRLTLDLPTSIAAPAHAGPAGARH